MLYVVWGIVSSGKVAGNTAANISFNFWLKSFSFGAAEFTILVLSGIFYVLMFLPIAIGLWFYARKKLGRAFALKELVEPKAMKLLVGIGFADAWIDFASTYAAGHVAVLTQAFAKSVEPLLTWVLEIIFLRKRGLAEEGGVMTRLWRAWGCSMLLLVSFSLSALGMCVHLYKKYEDRTTASFHLWYTLLYMTSIAAASCYNIVQGAYMRAYNRSGRQLAQAEEASKIAAPSVSIQCEDGSESHSLIDQAPHPHPPAYLVSGVVLAADMIVNCIVTLLIGSFIDAIPDFGSSSSVGAAWTNLGDGIRCVGECRHNLVYALITFGGWAIAYVADTVLNQLSPPLSSMVAQLSGPTQAMVLLIVPSWNLGAAASNNTKSWLLDMLSFVLMLAGAVLFGLHETRRKRQKLVEATATAARCDCDEKVASENEPAPVSH